MKPEQIRLNDSDSSYAPEFGRDFAAKVLERARGIRRRERISRNIAAGAVGVVCIAVLMVTGSRALAPDRQIAAAHLARPVSAAAQVYSTDGYSPSAVNDRDVFSTFLPGANEAAHFESAYAPASWIPADGWDSGS